MGKKRDEENYLDLAEEYQRNKYLPGYWTGGRLHPILRMRQKPKRLGYAWIFSGFLAGALGVFLFAWHPIAGILAIAVGLLQVIVGSAVVIRNRSRGT